MLFKKSLKTYYLWSAGCVSPANDNFTNVFMRRFYTPRGQIHKHSTSSFYAGRSQKRKNDSQVKQLFSAFGICQPKSCSQIVDEIDPTDPKSKKSCFTCLSFFSLGSTHIKAVRKHVDEIYPIFQSFQWDKGLIIVVRLTVLIAYNQQLN